MRVSLLVRALTVAFMVALSSPAFGSSEGEATTFLGIPRWIWLWLNLLLFLGILGYFIVPALKDFLETRATQIRESLAKSKSQREEAEEMRASLEGRIEELRREMDELLLRAEEDGEKERNEILAQAERERERLLAQTEEEIRLRFAQARKELTAFTAQLSAQLARQTLDEALSSDDVDRLFDESLARLEREADSSGMEES